MSPPASCDRHDAPRPLSDPISTPSCECFFVPASIISLPNDAHVKAYFSAHGMLCELVCAQICYGRFFRTLHRGRVVVPNVIIGAWSHALRSARVSHACSRPQHASPRRFERLGPHRFENSVAARDRHNAPLPVSDAIAHCLRFIFPANIAPVSHASAGIRSARSSIRSHPTGPETRVARS